jgi:ATP-dependent Lon protease
MSDDQNDQKKPTRKRKVTAEASGEQKPRRKKATQVEQAENEKIEVAGSPKKPARRKKLEDNELLHELQALDPRQLNLDNEKTEALLKLLSRAQSENEEEEKEEQENEEDRKPVIPDILPILPLKDTVVYPLTVFPLAVGQERSIKLIEEIVGQNGNRLVGLVAQKNLEIEQAGPNDSFKIGTVALVHKLLKVPDGSIRLAVQGLEKIELLEYVQTEPYLKAHVQVLEDIEELNVEVEALMRNSITLFQRLVALVPQIPDELLMTAINIEKPRQLAYLIATSVRMELEQRQEILETPNVRDKLEKLNAFLTKELEVLELGRKIQSQVQDELNKTQREYFLREQLKAIQKELGEEDPQQAEANQLREMIQKSKMPAEARREAERELDRLSRLPPAAAEYGVIKTYLDWLVMLPWNTTTEGPLDIINARKILDEDHYDLDRIKERILEYLAVRKLRTDRQKELEKEIEITSADGPGESDEPTHRPPTYDEVHHYTGPREPILCFVGPPGVGKTSLGQSIARALGRRFTRMSLGGMRDEAEIRGHRRTYIGAMPGRIIQALRRAESCDPVFMLDEIDKIGMDYRGDPSSALLEVLDPEQNRDFRDHYLDVPFDLSKVMFIATANLLDPIPPPLRDRMEILSLSGYTEDEKVKIAINYLIPKQLKANALTENDAEFDEVAIRKIIRDYTREAGVRNLERELANVLRKVARKVAEGQLEKTHVDAAKVAEMLGKPRYFFDVAERTQAPGVATGLAVTEVGGDILFIEATIMPGGKSLMVTGQLGDVMKESAQAALSYVRSRAKHFGIEPGFFEKNDIHIHIPAGAIPKDGPSAGITMTTAIASLLTNRPVHGDVAMTGEITLRGKVLPIGGVKEKVLAARRAGLKTVILPRLNERDLDDLSPDLKDDMKFVLVDNIDEVLENALEKPGEPHLIVNGHQPDLMKNGTEVTAPKTKSRKKSNTKPVL